MPKDVTDSDLEALRSNLNGEAVIPGDAGWDASRQAWNLAADQQPAVVVHAETAADVAAAVAFAGEHGMRVAPQGPGHGATSMGDLA